MSYNLVIIYSRLQNEDIYKKKNKKMNMVFPKKTIDSKGTNTDNNWITNDNIRINIRLF